MRSTLIIAISPTRFLRIRSFISISDFSIRSRADLMKTITSRQNPAARAFRDLADHPDPTGARVLLDGALLVRDAIDAGIGLELGFIAAPRGERPSEEGSLASLIASRGVEVIEVPDPVFAAIS